MKPVQYNTVDKFVACMIRGVVTIMSLSVLFFGWKKDGRSYVKQKFVKKASWLELLGKDVGASKAQPHKSTQKENGEHEHSG